VRLFFILGAPKSGTTWLQRIMDSHPQVSCFGEGHFIDQVALPMEVLLQHYNRQLTLVSEAVYAGAPPYAPLDADDIAKLIRTTIIGLMQRAGPPPQSLWWGDKTPAYSNHIDALNRLFPGCRFIDVLRDPRDVAVSALYHAKRTGHIEDLEGDTTRRRELIAYSMTRWLQHAHAVERATAELGDRMLQIHYRNLTAEPEVQLRRLFAHLPGIAVTDEIIGFVLQRSSFAAMSGREAGDTDDASFFRSGTNDQHLTELQPEESRFVEERLGAMMRRLGVG
jgi:hypothetical protein